jgi:glycine C-acetyltransferase
MYDVKNIGPNIRVNSKKLINLCSNDYLGIKSPKISKKQNQSSSRLIAGNDELFKILESKLAKHKSQDNALIFPTGYNDATLSTLAKLLPNLIIYSDELNHASMIEGIRRNGGEKRIFKHNDMSDLNSKIKTNSKRKFIITEGIFSMDGDCADLKIISEISQKHDAITILDDAHGDLWKKKLIFTLVV